MIYGLVDTFDAITSGLPTSLIPISSIRSIRALAGKLPDAMYAWGFECRLGSKQNQVDFGTCTGPFDCGPTILARAKKSTRRRGASTERAWATVTRFCNAWQNPRSPLHDLVRCVFLEFDVADTGGSASAPSFFAAMALPESRRSDTSEAAAGASVLREIIKERGSREGVVTALHCLDALPRGAVVVFVAVMFGRPRAPIRLHVWLPTEDADAYMRTIGLEAPSRAVQCTLTDLNRGADYVELAIDVADHVLPRAGLEFTFNGNPRRAERLSAIVDYAKRADLCTAAKSKALLKWPGVSRVTIPGQGWPCSLFKEISHLKVTFTPDRLLEMKAYLAVTPMFQLFN